MSKFYGLIDENGQVMVNNGNFTVLTTPNPTDFIIKFKPDMRQAFVLATARFFRENHSFDHEYATVVVSNAPDGNKNHLGFSICNSNNQRLGFSFNIYLPKLARSD
jgi:hypothetical protein